MQKRITVVVIGAIRKGDKFLMTKRCEMDSEDDKYFHGAWQLPGGGMQFGETPEQTLHREIKEELAIEIEIIKIIPKIYTKIRNNWQGIFIVYLCRMKNPEDKIILNNEASDWGWYTISQVNKMKNLNGSIEIMEDAILF